ncbi:DUF4244 domain-containing protein [Bifidobacterium callimiconis]|uniref:DUF4244 domain-containing protein n=1 Tax=Bifidobacterium callimiconis TaxID=2306973 RepID=A0A430FBW5_9BIFI|nr:DUF4244 domain-containing protein [Bifidobacterium callimiconis]RSX50327.1 hypothetical protein D2E23_1650 [Bifidobacterium callimiconis]
MDTMLDASPPAATGIIDRMKNMAQRANEKICLLDARGRLRTVTEQPESGLATAEYAMVMIAATGFAGLLVVILKSGTVEGLLNGLVERALSVAN